MKSKNAGYDVTTPYLVTNAFDYDEITIKNDTQVILAKSAQKDDEDTKNNNISENNAIDTNSNLAKEEIVALKNLRKYWRFR